MSKAIVTGGHGFVGHYLVELLEQYGYEVDIFDLKEGWDLRNFEEVRNYIDNVRPDYIFHLAALAFVPESFANPQRAIDINITGSLNILEAVRQLGLKTRIHLAGTSEEYGDAGPNEDDLLNPQSPYAISKMAMDHLGRLYAKSYGMNVVVTRAFNHTGAGRGEMYAESAFAKQIVEVERGLREVVTHGNLESVRNYTDVRDIVRAYVEAIHLPSGVYNICSNQNVTMQEVMLTLISKSTEKNIKTEVNPVLYRPSDFSFKKPSCKKFTDLTGWKPEYKLGDTLEDILNYWRQEL